MPLCNPILPLDEYIADAEPHVFGERIYLFGSHDKANADTYCMLDYVFWSAPIGDLSDWSNKGISYSVKQDPNHSDQLKYMYAPDVVQGNDGRYYLYYCLSGKKGKGGYGQPISVAVCDTPDGKYEYLGVVRNPDGSPMLDYVTFDPAIINDGGIIRLYYGTWYPFHERSRLLDRVFHRVESRMFLKTEKEIASCPEGVMGANHAELEEDMLTVKSRPVHILPNRVKGTSFEKHPFFEASSIRKIGNTYYFIYSSLHGHELCYATSQSPDRDFVYRGTIVSNGDVGLRGRKPEHRLNSTGTNHGSIECVNGSWYVFYHRNTNKTSYSRQVCAEPVTILDDGRIPQAEITSTGLNASPLPAGGVFPASICCNLTNGHMPHLGNGVIRRNIPYIANHAAGQTVIAVNGTRITYKNFSFPGGTIRLRLSLRADSEGTISVYLSDSDVPAGSLILHETKQWEDFTCMLSVPCITASLSFLYQGKKKVEIKEFEWMEAERH